MLNIAPNASHRVVVVAKNLCVLYALCSVATASYHESNAIPYTYIEYVTVAVVVTVPSKMAKSKEQIKKDKKFGRRKENKNKKKTFRT